MKTASEYIKDAEHLKQSAIHAKSKEEAVFYWLEAANTYRKAGKDNEAERCEREADIASAKAR